MNRQEMIGLAIFGLGILSVYVFAVLVVVRRIRTRERLRWPARSLLVVALLGLGCVAYGRFVEPHWIEVTETRIARAGVPAGHRPVRIVHLTDLHCDPEPRVEERVPEIVSGLRPDLIVFTGDAANSKEGIPVFRRCLSALAAIAPTFVVKGNWDAWYLRDEERFAGTGAVELDGTSARVRVGEVDVHVVGTAYGESHGFEPALDAIPGGGLVVALYHCPYPDLIPAAHRSRIDLFCAGHVHGGQVALPVYGAIVTLSKYGKRFERGLYPDAGGFGFPMYLGRGVGMEGGVAPRVRFCARPEIALIELVPGG